MKKIFILIASLASIVTFGQTPKQKTPSDVILFNRILYTNTNLSQLEQTIQQSLKKDDGVLVYLQFEQSPNKAVLLASNLALQEYIQHNVYSVHIKSFISLAQLQNIRVIGWQNVLSEDKINSYLTENNYNLDKTVEVLISVIKAMPEAAVAKRLAKHNLKLTAEQQWKQQDIWQVALPLDYIGTLAEEDFVKFINPKFNPQTLNYEVQGFTNIHAAHQPVAMGGRNLNGSGVTIGVGDNTDPVHVDFIDRVKSFNPIIANQHSLHTTGIAAGNGIKDERNKGAAPKAAIVEDFFSQIISNGATYHQDFDMTVSNNSYGNILANCAYAGTYDVYSQYTDQQMRDFPHLLNVFASANDGNMSCSPYPIGYATIAGAFQCSKNVLTVGSLGKTRDIPVPSSSTGPVKDGRLKPEITAVGNDVLSTTFNNSYEHLGGTSMASPNAAGASALIVERYKSLHAGQNPKSALVKLLLMNGADDLGTPGPDFKHGYGIMNLGHSLNMLDSNRYFTNTINTNQEQTFTITIPAGKAKAKVMLYWHDPAAAPLSTATLINDLDLTVTAPNATVALPLVLDATPSQVLVAATPGIDRVNNVEQVVIDNPIAGTYTIKVKGFNVPEINQDYFVAYDFMDDAVALQQPIGGESFNANANMNIYWEASPGTNGFTIAYSIDNGTNWSTIDNNVPADKRAYSWAVPSIASAQCLIRVTRNNTSQTSQTNMFTIISRPIATLSPATEQCAGSIKMSWNTVTGANAYRVFKKVGPEMVEWATVTNTTYTLSGLSPDSTYWIAVAPVINGVVGMRSIALDRKPDNGNCVGVAPGNLAMGKIVSPASGRILTSKALSSSHPLTVIISNFDAQVANNYRVSYKLNNNAWVSQIFTDVINPTGNRQLVLGNLNLSVVGTYDITVAISNLAVADPVMANDTMKITVRQIANPAINLSGGYLENFETVDGLNIIGQTAFGITNAEQWDFEQSKPKGRVRSYVNSGITIEGTKSISLDNAQNQMYDIPGSSYNTFTGTFNLSNYNTANWEVRCEFDYMLHGYPKFDTGNAAWVRGSDTDPWLPLRSYDIDTNNMGVIYNSGTLSLTDILSNGGQNFSSSTQIRFTQQDTSLIAASYFGNGFTMDNFKLYLVTDDVQLLSIDSIYNYNCGLSATVPMRIKVANGVNNTVYNVNAFYQIDNQPVVMGLIDSIAGKDTIEYVFDQTMDLSGSTDYTLSAWVNVPTDTYRLNDSIIDFNIKNQPVISTFPYLQDFETNNGFFFPAGRNSTWAYGTPASNKINHAASGTKAWKTNLAGNYNKQEISYLYSPCFDISTLAKPTLSFSLASDVEIPGSSIYDMAFVEYSHDGYTWQKLGQAGEGTNWYTNDSGQAWTNTNETYWHVATIPLPQGGNILSFRFVLYTDQGAEYEGLAIDDIHIYDLVKPIFNQEKFANAISQNIGAGQSAGYISAGSIGLHIANGTSVLGNTEVQVYKHLQFINNDSTQYYLPKNFTIQSASAPGDSVTVRFYIPDEAMKAIREDATCYSCSKVYEVQGLGITKYEDGDKSKINNMLQDNVGGAYSFITKENIRWIPYDIGYYAETKVKSFSEFWFNDGGPTKDKHIGSNLFTFTVSHYKTQLATLAWTSFTDIPTFRHEVQRADDSLNFVTVATVNSIRQNGYQYNYIDTPTLNSPRVHYRIKSVFDDGTESLSLIRTLSWEGKPSMVNVYPNPVRDGVLNVEWFKGNEDGFKWRLYNVIGQLVSSGDIDDNNFDGKRTLELGNMGINAGMYMLKIVSNKEEWEFKIVFQ